MTNISIIVAIAENYAIGKNNNLLWHIPDDLKRFKKLTSEHTVIMGKNTFLSLPVRPLPKRKNIVISDNKNDNFQGCLMAYSIDDALNLMDKDRENFIMGGGMIYKTFMPLANKLYITKVHQSFEADVFFPAIDVDIWDLISTEDHYQDEPQKLKFSYQIFTRK